MEISFSKDRIIINKKEDELDTFVIDFTSILNKLDIKYVIISGYVSILFGRSRLSEDVDILLEKLSIERFKELWKNLAEKFECIISDDPNTAYKDYLLHKLSIRFSRPKRYVPNMEVGFISDELDMWTLENRREAALNGNRIFISRFEIQIAYKLYLGSEKDIEDARHIYKMFKDRLDMPLLKQFNQKLKIEHMFKEYLENEATQSKLKGT